MASRPSRVVRAVLERYLAPRERRLRGDGALLPRGFEGSFRVLSKLLRRCRIPSKSAPPRPGPVYGRGPFYTAPDVASMAQHARRRRDGVEGARKTLIEPYPWASSGASAAASADNCSFFVGGAAGKLTHL